jgi:hypothetical protein
VEYKADTSKLEDTGLDDTIARWTGNQTRFGTASRGLSIYRREAPTEPISYMLAPGICLIGHAAPFTPVHGRLATKKPNRPG